MSRGPSASTRRSSEPAPVEDGLAGVVPRPGEKSTPARRQHEVAPVGQGPEVVPMKFSRRPGDDGDGCLQRPAGTTSYAG